MTVETYKSQMIMRKIEILDAAGVSHRCVQSDQNYFIVVTAEAIKDVPNVSVGWVIKSADGTSVYGTSTAVQGHFLDFKAGETKQARFTFKPLLALGTYYLSGGVAETLTPEDEIHNYIMRDYIHDALKFVVVSDFDRGIANMGSALMNFKKVDANGH
jgi:Wzt C-terminal domain